MSNPFRTPEDYELFLYTITEQFPAVRRSAVTFVRAGATLARAAGELYLDGGVRIVIRERVVYPSGSHSRGRKTDKAKHLNTGCFVNSHIRHFLPRKIRQ